MEIKENLFLFLGKKRNYLTEYLDEKHILYEEFPLKQKLRGFDIIQVENLLFWFDCADTIYGIHVNLEKSNSKTIPLFFDGIALNTIGYADVFLNFLNIEGKLFDSKELYDENIGKYMLIVYEFENKVKFILNVDNKNTLFSLVMNYDGYSTYQYKKGITLCEFLNN